jgi:hypothetical protein
MSSHPRVLTIKVTDPIEQDKKKALLIEIMTDVMQKNGISKHQLADNDKVFFGLAG